MGKYYRRSCRRLVGGNSGYDGYRMSLRAVAARDDGRFPITDFRKEYHITLKSLLALVHLNIIGDDEWHHTGCYGRQTTFYYWRDEDDKTIYFNNKKQVDRLARECNYDAIVAVFKINQPPLSSVGSD